MTSFVGTVAVAISDTVVVLTLTCGLSKCCADGKTSPAFAPNMEVCNSGNGVVEGRLVTITAILTVVVGILFSLSRAVQLETAAGGGGWISLAIVYVGLRSYQISWLWSTFMAAPAVLWLITGIAVTVLAISDVRKAVTKEDVEYTTGRDDVLYAVAVADAITIGLPAVGGVPEELRPAFYIIQSVCAVVAVWQAHRYYVIGNAVASEADGTPEGKGAASGDKLPGALRSRIRNRNLCI